MLPSLEPRVPDFLLKKADDIAENSTISQANADLNLNDTTFIFWVDLGKLLHFCLSFLISKMGRTVLATLFPGLNYVYTVPQDSWHIDQVQANAFSSSLSHTQRCHRESMDT